MFRVHTTSTSLIQSKPQYKIKLRLKNETALTAGLEHEEVLGHSLLDFFSTAMLVKKLPLRELIPYTPQTRKNHPLY
jgi:hypothetical protein